MEDLLEKSISILIEDQFPEWYRQEGPMFVAFVREYYEWMESRSLRKTKYLRKDRASISVTYNSANVYGSNTLFTENFSNGDYIAISKQTEDDDYEIFQIDTVANNTYLILKEDKLPQFAFTKTNYGTVDDYGNPLYYSRRMFDIIDIDDTLEEFLVYFKQQYLNDIQLETITDTRTLVKHALDIYRSKGTERSIDLLFRIVYGVSADLYYPSTDLFRTSSGTWYKPTYLELSPNEITVDFVERQIEGIESGATAFVESVIRRTISGKIIDIAYISAINGNFKSGEKIIAPTLENVTVEQSPFIVGSLNNIRIPITGIGNGFSVGDTLTVTSQYGREAQARVANTSNTTGKLAISLVNGGYGYTVNTVPVISTKVITLSNVQPNTLNKVYFEDEEVFLQPYANISYTNANGTPEVGDSVYTYLGPAVAGRGTVLEVQELTSSTGDMVVAIRSGDLQIGNALFFNTNTIGANISSYTNKTATGNVVGYNANVILSVDNVSGSFQSNEVVFGTSASGRFTTDGIINQSGIIGLSATEGIFSPGELVYGSNSGATANVTSVQITLGIKDETNTFITTAGNFVKGSLYGSNATITSISSGSGLAFTFANSLLYEEAVEISNDFLLTYAPVALNATEYNFPADPAGNLTSNTIENLLSYTTWNIGKLQTIENFNPGTGYNILPIVRVKEPFIDSFGVRGLNVLRIADATASFSVGELVTQETGDARGIVVSANATDVIVERLRFYNTNNFFTTANDTTQLVGDSSGATANIISVSDVSSSNYLGNNVSLEFNISVANGAVTNLEIISSGFGFVNGEIVTAVGNGTSLTGEAVLERHGTGPGFYYDTGGFLSDNKKLFDGIYWQEYSYEIRSSVQLNRYSDMLRRLLHVAGTQYFGNLVHTAVITGNTRVSESVINAYPSPLPGFGTIYTARVLYTEDSDIVDASIETNDGYIIYIEDEDIADVVATQFLRGSLSKTEAADVLVSSAGSFDAEVEFTEDAETLSSSTDVLNDVSVIRTEAADTLDGYIQQNLAEVSVSEEADSFSIITDVPIDATTSVTEDAETLEASGTVETLAAVVTPTFTFTNTNYDSVASNEFYWNNVPIGSAESDRVVVVAIGSTTGANSSATIQSEIRINNQPINMFANAIYNSGWSAIGYAKIPSGTTANVVVRPGNIRNYFEGGGAVFTVTGAHTEPTDMFSTINNWTTQQDLSYKIGPKGAAIAIASFVANATPTWNGFNVHTNANSGTDALMTTAYRVTTAGGNPVVANVQMSATGRLSTGVITFNAYSPANNFSTGFISDSNDTLEAAVDVLNEAIVNETETGDTLSSTGEALVERTATVTYTEAAETADSTIDVPVGFRAGSNLGIGTLLDGGTLGPYAMPDGIVEGDLIIAAVMARAEDELGDGTLSDTSGGNSWTKYTHVTLNNVAEGDTDDGRLTVWYKTATAADASANITYTLPSGGSGNVAAISLISVYGHDTTTPITDLEELETTVASTQSMTGFTPSVANGLIVAIFGSPDNVDCSTVSMTDPGTFDKRDEHLNAAGKDVACQIFTKEKDNTNATGNLTWQQNTQKQVVVRFYIQPS